DSIDMLELKTALGQLKQNTGETFDLIGMDACLMGMVEVGYQIRDYCTVMVSSEESVPWDGWDYTFLEQMGPGSDYSPKETATLIVNYAYDSYNDGAPYPSDDPYIVFSAFDLTKFEDGFISAVNDLSQLLIASMEDNKSKVQNAYTMSYRMEDYRFYVDFKDFMLSLNYEGISNSVANAATEAADKHDDIVFYHRAGSGFPYCYGLSIYFEAYEASYDSRYDGDSGFLEFTADSLWDDLIQAFYDPGHISIEIEFDPLPDTENVDKDIELACFVTSSLPLADELLKVHYRTDSDEFDLVALTSGMLPNQYFATIPGQPNNTQVQYYILAENVAGAKATSPEGAPNSLHEFWIRLDTTPPTIQHEPLGDQPATRDYFEVLCLIRDNLGVNDGSVNLHYRLEGEDEDQVTLVPLGESMYSGQIPSAGLLPGNHVWYWLEASDLAHTPNHSRLPVDGYFSFMLIPSLGSVLLINDDAEDSADVFREALDAAGYVVESHTPGQKLPASNFDLVVYCLGEQSEPIPVYQEGLVNYVQAGGRLLIESGDVAWAACEQYPSALSDFRQYVLHIDSWHADYGDILVLKNSDTPLATTPNVLDSTIDFYGEFLSTRDVCVPASDANALYNWSRYSRPGLIFYDDNADESDGGQIIYMTFAIPYVSDDEGQRTKLIENSAYYLSKYVRDHSAPVLSDVWPSSGSVVPPNSSVSFKLTDLGTGVNTETIELTINGQAVSTAVSYIDGVHEISVSHTPQKGFTPDSRFELEVTATDFVGNWLSDSTYWFETGDEDSRAPAVLAGGFMQSQVLDAGDYLQIVAKPQAFGDGNSIATVELVFEGSPLGIFLNDEGQSGDSDAGDGIYSLLFMTPAGMPSGEYILQIVATDDLGQVSAPWPELTVIP
ncbi:MAG: hypothetical protein JW941_00380, partial [Candidatus Coatesbacteria bacterium]|nr:hypothetical protein [Candidatus Coatesbacteria bacterium]